MVKTKEDFINSITLGNNIAFKLGNYMLTGRVIEINPKNYVVRTLNNSIYTISKSDIVWVKKGSKYPKGIYNSIIYPKQKEDENHGKKENWH